MTDPQPYTGERLEAEIEVFGCIEAPLYDPRLAATLRDYRRVLAENAALREDKARLVRAIVEMALPYEALRMDGESRRWIAPEVWKHIVEATEAARVAVKDYNAARSGGEG